MSVTDKTTKQTTTVPNPASYTIIFNVDGTTTGKADCNSFTGTWSQQNGFHIQVAPNVMAACGTMDSQYLDLLNQVAAGGPDGAGNLALETAGGAQRMLFKRRPRAHGARSTAGIQQHDHGHRLAVDECDRPNDQADDDRAEPRKLHHYLQRRWHHDRQSRLQLVHGHLVAAKWFRHRGSTQRDGRLRYTGFAVPWPAEPGGGRRPGRRRRPARWKRPAGHSACCSRTAAPRRSERGGLIERERLQAALAASRSGVTYWQKNRWTGWTTEVMAAHPAIRKPRLTRLGRRHSSLDSDAARARSRRRAEQLLHAQPRGQPHPFNLKRQFRHHRHHRRQDQDAVEVNDPDEYSAKLSATLSLRGAQGATKQSRSCSKQEIASGQTTPLAMTDTFTVYPTRMVSPTPNRERGAAAHAV